MNNNPKILREFFTLFKSVVDESHIPTRVIFNIDEKGFLLSLAKSSEIIVYSSKKYYFVTQNASGETVTVLEAVSATGFATPPMIIYKGPIINGAGIKIAILFQKIGDSQCHQKDGQIIHCLLVGSSSVSIFQHVIS